MSATYRPDVPVNQLRPNPWNPNVQDDATREKERRSIREHGFIDPITVRASDHDEPYEIVDGYHRWLAAQDEGMKAVPLIDLGVIPDVQAKKLTLLLNELRGRSDTVKLAELLRSLDLDADSLAADLPYSAIEIDSLVKSLDDFGWGEEKVLDAAARDAQRKQGAGVEEARFQLGSIKGNIPKWLAEALMAEWSQTAEACRSRSPEAVLTAWLARLQPAKAATGLQ